MEAVAHMSGGLGIIAGELLENALRKGLLLLRRNLMVLGEVLLPVGDAVHQIDGNRLVYALVLSHAKEAVLHGDKHQTAGADQQGNPVLSDVPRDLTQPVPGARLFPPPPKQKHPAAQQEEKRRAGSTAEQPERIQHEQPHGGDDPCAQPEDDAEAQKLQNVALFPPDTGGECGKDHAQKNDPRK